MAWSLLFRSTNRPHQKRTRRTRLEAEALDERIAPAALSAYETSALQTINQLRADPAAFAQDLRSLYLGGSYQSPNGYAANDPIWTDIRGRINAREATSSWRSGFTSTGANTFVAHASALPARAPLVWDSAMQDGTVGHDQWMVTYAVAHSVFTQGQAPQFLESQASPIPGIPRNFNVAAGDYYNYIGLGLHAAGENISYAYNIGGATLQAYRNGLISLNGYYQRLAYADVTAFMLEYSNGSTSSPWGHLDNLAGDYNVLGLSQFFYENPVEGASDGVAASYFTTHRTGRRPNASYANVFVYQDNNSNNVYDAGEGLTAQVTSTFAGGTFTLPSTGYNGVAIPATGTYSVSASYLGVPLGSQQLVANGTNKTFAFKVAANADFSAPTSQIAALAAVQTNPNFLVQWSGSDTGGSGVANYDVFVSIDGGAFSLWQTATTLTQATYNGSPGHTYGFYSVATDIAGNRQATPSAAQASTFTQFVTATTLTSTPNASTGGTLVTLTATVSPSPGNLGTVTFRDNGVALVGGSNVAMSNGVATFQVSNLSAGTHPISAGYSGATNFAASTSNTVNQVVAAAPQVLSVTPNANIASLAGGQRSRIASLVVAFDRAVQLDANAVTLALHMNNVSFGGVAQPTGYGGLPTSVAWTTSDNITWIVTFVGNTDNGGDGLNSIKDGVYDLNIDGAKVHPVGALGVNMAGVSTTTFYRLFGDTDETSTPIGGTENVDFETLISVTDNFAFRGAFNNSANYKAFLDFGGDGSIGVGDNFEFRGRFNKRLTWRV